MSNLHVMSPNREAGEDFLSRQVFERGGKQFLTVGGTDSSNIIGKIDSLDDESSEKDNYWNIMLQGDYDRIEKLVTLSADYPELEFWIQIWDFENLSPAGLAQDLSFSQGIITKRNQGDELATEEEL